MDIIEESKNKAIELFYKLKTEKGFIASSVDIDNYKRVWSRDGIIIGLAALTTNDLGLEETFTQTLKTLKKFQDKTGRIPSNVSLDEKKISYGTTVGRIDATIWFVLAVTKYVLENDKQEFWNEFKDSVAKAVFYLECLELNGRGLIYVPLGGDWADEYLNEGYVLFDECLYALALKYYYQVVKDKEILEKSEKLEKLIEINYFPRKENVENENVYHKALYESTANGSNTSLPISSLTPFRVLKVTDLLAISLLFNLGLNLEKDKIEEELKKIEKTDFPILPAFSPVIDKDHPNWNYFTNNHLFRFKNKPNEFHNGGLWPMVHGFYLASKPHLEKSEIENFASVLADNQYNFPEFFHGKTYEASGTMNLGMSAAGFLFAYNRFKNNKLPFEL